MGCCPVLLDTQVRELREAGPLLSTGMNLRKAAMPKPSHREQRAEAFCRLKRGTEFQRIPEGGELGKQRSMESLGNI